MTDKVFEKAVDLALVKAGEAVELAYALHGLIGGDDPERAAYLLEKYGYVDENGEWI